MIIGISGKKQHGKDTVAKMIQWLDVQEQDKVSYNLDTITDVTKWEVKRFADKLKQIVALMIGCTVEDLEDNEFKETPLGREWWVTEWKYIDHEDSKQELLEYGTRPHEYGEYEDIHTTPRRLLQLVGTEGGRELIHPNIWVNALMADYKPITYESVPAPPEFPLNVGSYDVPIYPDWLVTDVRFPNEVQAIKDAGGIIIRVVRDGMENTDEHESETALDDYKDFDVTLFNNFEVESLYTLVKATVPTLLNDENI